MSDDRDVAKVSQIVPKVVIKTPRAPQKTSKRSKAHQKKEAAKTVSVKVEIEDEAPVRMFRCPHCPAEYASSRALGGHTSKQH
jgi:predicted RNA-binding Zn-ribbon protein involved in translation (DUF1610 family)